MHAPALELIKLLSGLRLKKRGKTSPPNAKAWPKKVWDKVGEAYPSTVEWLVTQLNIHSEDAEDLIHEVFRRLRLCRAFRVTNWGRYLGSAAIRKYKRSRRPKGKTKVLLFSELEKEDREGLFQIRAPGPMPDEEAAERELIALLPAAIAKLPARQRQVLTLEREGKRPKEIQAILGLKNVQAVYAHRKKAIAMLRRNPIFREEK